MCGRERETETETERQRQRQRQRDRDRDRDRELAKCRKELNQKKLGKFMLQNSVDWIEWKKNPPLASHWMPPTGMFGTPDLYCRKRWRWVQHIRN